MSNTSQTQLDTVKHSTEGNTKISSVRSRAWCFTLNNYSNEDILFFSDTLDTEKYAFQEEVGENNTPHLQGIVYFKNARTFHQLKQLHGRAHWEKTKSIKDSFTYCTNANKRAPQGQVYSKGFTVKKTLKLISEENFYPYQKEILNICMQEPDERYIYWFWEPNGNVGKTAIIKYLLNRFKNTAYYISGGKAADICSQINDFDADIELFLVNFPRTSEGFVSYNGIEQVKDGLTSSGKYKGGFKLFNPPHVLIMANFPPDTSTLSSDRWKIYEIDNNKQLTEYKDIPLEY